MKKVILSYFLFTILININIPAKSQATVESRLIVCTAPTGLSATAITKSGATLSWLPVSHVSSYTVQYKLSSILNWTTAAKATTSTSVNIADLTTATLYDWRVRSNCSSGSSTYTQSQFTTSDFYCTSSGSTLYEYINKVALGSINNTSGNNNGYHNYTGLSTSLAAGTSYTITLTPGFTGTSYREYWTVFIDYNQDGTLNNSGEIVTTANSYAAVSGTFTVPVTAKNGSTRMRIVMKYASPARSNPCGSYNYGEVEDYTVNISGGMGLAAVTAIASDNNAIGHNKAISMSVAPDPGVASVQRPVSEKNMLPVSPDFLRAYVTPNPVKEIAKLVLSTSSNLPASIQFLDILGRSYKTIKVSTINSGAINISVNDVPPGNYIILLKQGDQTTHARLIVERK